MLVHFPIAWWIAAVLVDLIGVMLPRAAWATTTASTLYPAGAVAATVTYLPGRQAAMTVLTPGMAHPIVLEHWNWALATTLVFWMIALLRLAMNLKHQPASRWIRVALASLFETGERGARLVFQYGLGVSASH